MCDLEERFRKCIEKYDISKDQLTYSWKGQNEDEVNKLFTDWNTELKEVLQDKSKSTEEKSKELKNIISKILKWGGIHRLKSERLSHYIEKIQKISEDQEIDKDTLLSSWTKILAAYDPQKYYIYDSRVAIALKILVPEYDWFIPKRRNDTVCSYLRNCYKNVLTEQESYKRYLDLFSQITENLHGSYEKKLFMLGGEITLEHVKSLFPEK